MAALQSLCAGMETVGSSELRVTPPPLSRPPPVSRLAGISHQTSLTKNINQPQQLVWGFYSEVNVNWNNFSSFTLKGFHREVSVIVLEQILKLANFTTTNIPHVRVIFHDSFLNLNSLNKYFPHMRQCCEMRSGDVVKLYTEQGLVRFWKAGIIFGFFRNCQLATLFKMVTLSEFWVLKTMKLFYKILFATF